MDIFGAQTSPQRDWLEEFSSMTLQLAIDINHVPQIQLGSTFEVIVMGSLLVTGCNFRYQLLPVLSQPLVRSGWPGTARYYLRRFAKLD